MLFYYDFIKRCLIVHCIHPKGRLIFGSSTSNIFFLILRLLSRLLFFWSTAYNKKIRANLDGSRQKVVFEQSYYGVDVDEREDRFYTLNSSTNKIISFDLNGQDLRTLKVSIDPIDFSRSLECFAKGDTHPTLIAGFTDPIMHTALFGQRLSFARSNPCEKNRCAYLCVLIKASSYRCLCPDAGRWNILRYLDSK